MVGYHKESQVDLDILGLAAPLTANTGTPIAVFSIKASLLTEMGTCPYF
jgi:hypothetical protein